MVDVVDARLFGAEARLDYREILYKQIGRVSDAFDSGDYDRVLRNVHMLVAMLTHLWDKQYKDEIDAAKRRYEKAMVLYANNDDMLRYETHAYVYNVIQATIKLMARRGVIPYEIEGYGVILPEEVIARIKAKRKGGKGESGNG